MIRFFVVLQFALVVVALCLTTGPDGNAMLEEDKVPLMVMAFCALFLAAVVEVWKTLYIAHKERNRSFREYQQRNKDTQ